MFDIKNEFDIDVPEKAKEYTKIYLEEELHSLFERFYECESPIEKIFTVELYRLIENNIAFNETLSNNNFQMLEISRQKRIDKHRVDFFIYLIKRGRKNMKTYIIELDGHAFHEKTKDQAKKDKQKDRYLTRQGYKVLRFTGSEIFNDCTKCVKELKEIILEDIKRC